MIVFPSLLHCLLFAVHFPRVTVFSKGALLLPIHLTQTNNMESGESIVEQIERFENYCIKKRRLEGDIESVLVRMDEDAVEAVECAECELENTKRECALMEARVERARRGDFDGAEKFRESGRRSPLAIKEAKALQESDSNSQLTNSALNEPIQLHPGIEPSPATSPPILASMSISTADSDDFSVISNTQQEAAGPRYDKESIPNPAGHSNNNASDDFLAILVQRYADICYERRTIQEEIENRLEKKERIAVEKLTCAKIALETTRQKAVEIVAALNEASGGDSMVNLPAGVLGSMDSKAISSSAGGAYSSVSGSIVSPSTTRSVLVSGPVKANEHANPTPTMEERPLPTSTVFSPEQNTIRPTMVEHLSQSILRRIPASEIPAATPLSAPAPLPQPQVPITQQAIFMKYDELMIAAKAAGSGLSMEKVPWPLFTLSYDQYPFKNIVASRLVDSSVTSFIEGYVRWKGWNLKVEGESMLGDWKQLDLQVPERKPGGKACMQRVVSILGALMRS